MVESNASLQRTVRSKPPYAVDWATLLRLREDICSRASMCDSVLVSAEELCKCWLRLAEAEIDRARSSTRERDLEFIEIRVQQSLREVDLQGSGRVDIDVWCNHMLLTRSSSGTMRAVMNIIRLVDTALEVCPSILVVLQNAFEVMAANASEPPEVAKGEGRLLVRELVATLAWKLWHLRPPIKETASKKTSDFSFDTPDEFISNVVLGLDLDASCDRTTCADFLALCLGRRERPVTLHLYDLSRGAATVLAPWLINQELEGVWHSGIVVYRKEYYFGGDIYFDTPSETGFGTPRIAVHLGHTLRQRDELHTFIVDELKSVFSREAYDPANNNCNHFTDRVSMWLVGRHIPEEVLKQPELMLHTNLGRVIRPVLTWVLGQYFEPRCSAEEIDRCVDGQTGGKAQLAYLAGSRGARDVACSTFHL